MTITILDCSKVIIRLLRYRSSLNIRQKHELCIMALRLTWNVYCQLCKHHNLTINYDLQYYSDYIDYGGHANLNILSNTNYKKLFDACLVLHNTYVHNKQITGTIYSNNDYDLDYDTDEYEVSDLSTIQFFRAFKDYCESSLMFSMMDEYSFEVCDDCYCGDSDDD